MLRPTHRISKFEAYQNRDLTPAAKWAISGRLARLRILASELRCPQGVKTMAQSYVNSKGVTTVPLDIRRLLGLEGETVVWTLMPSGAVLVQAKYKRQEPGAARLPSKHADERDFDARAGTK